ncbi:MULTISPECIES: methylamine utilization protein [unclassified Pseudomonas]|uniref:methylamine utilization protein n=1 Tax=unclassified Pseudomonas TaxID=196821 RepID=UPI002360ABC8|nr:MULTISPECIES: methylamine utilization protein [unclassified Pseudomonas]
MNKHWFVAGWLALGLGAAQAAEVAVQVVDGQGAPLADAVVMLSGQGLVPERQPAAIDQQNRRFVPHVLVVATGTAVSFPNTDDIRHQVYSFSSPKRFELPLYHGLPSTPVVFDQPGVVVVGCNIHDWMVGYVYVTTAGRSAVTDSQGRVRLEAPDGHYQLALWHPDLSDKQEVAQPALDVAGKPVTLKLQLAVQPKPQPAEPASSAFEDAFHKATHDEAHP